MTGAAMFATLAANLHPSVAQADTPVPNGSGGLFRASPVRVLDTRSTGGIGGYTTPMPANSWRSVQVAGVGGVPSSGVSAVQVTVTAASSTAGSVYLSQYLTTPQPILAEDYGASDGSANTAIVPMNTSGKIEAETTTSLNLIIDVQGYYSSGSTAQGGYVPVDPARIVWTANNQGLNGPLTTGSTYTIQVAGSARVPASASAIFANVAVKDTSGSGYLTPYSSDSSTRPNVSLSFPGGPEASSIGTTIPLGSDGSFKLYVGGNGSGVQIFIDVAGYFAASTGNGGAFTVDDGTIARSVNVSSHATHMFSVAGLGGLPTAGTGISAAALEFTATSSVTGDGGWYLDAWADDDSQPKNTNTLNTADSGTVSNLATIDLGVDGGINFYNGSPDTVTISIYVQGWYSEVGCGSTDDGVDPLVSIPNTQSAIAAGTVNLSALMVDTADQNVQGTLILTDSAGNVVGGTPTATNSTASGTRMIYNVPTTALTQGNTYSWYFTGYTAGPNCGSLARSATKSFVAPAPDPVAPAPSNTVTLTGADLQAATAQSGASDCQSGSCALTKTGNLNVGYDGDATWISSIKADLSRIPAGSSIGQATLKLSNAACLTGSQCGPNTLTVNEASTDVSNANSGADLAGISPANTVAGTYSSGSFDVTDFVSEWVDGIQANDGLVLQAATATDPGASFPGPNSSSSSPQLTISYTPPSPPATPQNLSAIPGDGGSLLTWVMPQGNTATNDPMQDVSSYGITVSDSSGAVVRTMSVTASPAFVTGLQDGATYSASVAASNAIGTGPSGEISFTPVAVSGGPANYINAASQELAAESAIVDGTSTTTAQAEAGQSLASYFDHWLNFELGPDAMASASRSSNNQSIANDSIQIGSALAVSSDSTQVSVYISGTENYTTVDASTSPAANTPGQNDLDYVYNFDTSGPSPVLSTREDLDSAVNPLTTTSESNASSVALDAVTQTATLMPTVAMNADGSFASDTIPVDPTTSKGYRYANLAGVARWADAHYNKPGDPEYSDDCTDFASQALYFGGGLKMQYDGQSAPLNSTHAWYNGFRGIYNAGFVTKTWGYVQYNWYWLVTNNHSQLVPYTGDAQVGDVVYVDWTGGNSNHMKHMAVASKIVGNNVYVDQHSNDRYREPIFQARGYKQTWRGSNPHLGVWIARPREVA